MLYKHVAFCSSAVNQPCSQKCENANGITSHGNYSGSGSKTRPDQILTPRMLHLLQVQLCVIVSNVIICKTQNYISNNMQICHNIDRVPHSHVINIINDSDMKSGSLLGNGSVNTFPRKRKRVTTEERCFLRSPPRSLLRNGAVDTSLLQWINTQQ
jgi:hypothetical protein